MLKSIKVINKKHKESTPTSFLEGLATIDFDRFYTTRVRILCHSLMWIILAAFYYIGFRYAFGSANFSAEASVVFTLRSMICNMTVFYIFFYLLVPYPLSKHRVILTIFSFFFSIILWLIINHYIMIFISNNISITDKGLRESVLKNASSTLLYIISPRVVAINFISIFSTLAPFFFIKITFDITRYYSKWFKAERKANEIEKKKLLLEKETMELKMDNLSLERDFLKAQLNPHFLFNTLNNLYSMVMEKDPHTPKVITRLAGIMRYTLYESNEEQVLLAKELSFLKNYIELEKLRYNTDAPITCRIDDSGVDQQTIAPLLTFTFVENGFKYGLKSKKDRFLDVKVSVLNNILYFSIANDKPDSPCLREKEGSFGGIGVHNVRKRLQGLYPGKHKLCVEERGNSFHVEMEIELR